MLHDRTAGVLLHPTSLPGRYGIGDLGAEAHAYVDWLGDAGVGWWQVLPLNQPGDGNSPYCARSTFAGNVALVSPELLRDAGLLEDRDLARAPVFQDGRVDYERAVPFKSFLLTRAHERFLAGRGGSDIVSEFEAFRATHAGWLDDYGLFAALRTHHADRGWFDWPEPLALRDARALDAWREAHAGEVLFQEFCQFIFARQWHQVREHAARRGVRILGDLPMFVALDSAEVWAHRELFRLDPHGRPTHVAGVPPDYFNENGQLWGNPLYDWDAMVRTGFAWWVERIRRTLETVDAVRLDHFRGFASFWEVEAGEKTARNGRWEQGPGRTVFDAIARELGDLPFLAEDLGDIDESVHELRRGLGLPGMAVLQFAFSPAPRSTFLPYRHDRRLAVYTGTHDNNTSRGWFEDDANDAERDFARRYLAIDGDDIHWAMVRAALSSVADLAIIPHQDLAGLGTDGRMNLPGTIHGNWSFRLAPSMLDPVIRNRFAEMIWIYGRQRGQV
jgi:4-alpha-glucanotransferase